MTGLPKGFPVPVVVVQHRHSDGEDGLTDVLAACTVLPVEEPNDKQALCAGRVYVAPAAYHLLVEPDCLSLSTEAPVNSCRPSVDVLFDSAADSHGSGVVAVVLTGAGTDGATGAVRVKSCGGVLVVQEPSTAHARGMPDAALSVAPADHVLPLESIAPLLVRLFPAVAE